MTGAVLGLLGLALPRLAPGWAMTIIAVAALVLAAHDTGMRRLPLRVVERAALRSGIRPRQGAAALGSGGA